MVGRRWRDQDERLGEAFGEIDGLFNPGRKYVKERQDYVAMAKEDDRESGARPLDLDSGVVRLRRRESR